MWIPVMLVALASWSCVIAASDERVLGRAPERGTAPQPFGVQAGILGELNDDVLGLANVTEGLFGRQAGNPACCSDGSCCEPGNKCMALNGENNCCPNNYETCSGTMCGNPGSTCCRAGAACGPDQGPCCGQGCCGFSQFCCADGCCDGDKVCCDSGCCDSGEHCCSGSGSESCCPDSSPCCGGVCCPPERECCGDVCCETDMYCKSRGVCAERQTATTTATQRVVTVTERLDAAPTVGGRGVGWMVAGVVAVGMGLG